jgi:hypothetical protein
MSRFSSVEVSHAGRWTGANAVVGIAAVIEKYLGFHFEIFGLSDESEWLRFSRNGATPTRDPGVEAGEMQVFTSTYVVGRKEPLLAISGV